MCDRSSHSAWSTRCESELQGGFDVNTKKTGGAYLEHSVPGSGETAGRMMSGMPRLSREVAKAGRADSSRAPNLGSAIHKTA